MVSEMNANGQQFKLDPRTLKDSAETTPNINNTLNLQKNDLPSNFFLEEGRNAYPRSSNQSRIVKHKIQIENCKDTPMNVTTNILDTQNDQSFKQNLAKASHSQVSDIKLTLANI
uniref:Uncharacterized protein n=1 Tax=Strombidium rassoulzadegani TaxID=1082188 RepID=A0A7S3CSK5_9SPIT|mmetsp:Transcript_3681/g.6269  ORF Transcript_3681/g.6269 Transcript_3681/m.6269 type:complete len:115 (+) Transcript_3681:1-345(+)